MKIYRYLVSLPIYVAFILLVATVYYVLFGGMGLIALMITGRTECFMEMVEPLNIELKKAIKALRTNFEF